MTERIARAEFDCEGCGIHVYSIGRDTIPTSQLCSVCEWLCEHVPDPEEMMRLRERLGLIEQGKPAQDCPGFTNGGQA
jgi:hypothetical protein